MSFFKTKISVVILATATLITGCASTTNQSTISPDRKQILLFSNSEMQRMADTYYREMLAEERSKGKLDTKPQLVARVRKIADNLIPHVAAIRPEAVSWDWKAHVVTDDTVNAYVMPNAKIVFYSGIIEKLQLTDSEIAAIMGHEMAHALREHSREKMSHRTATTTSLTIAAAAFGLGNTGMQALGLAGSFGLHLPHSRSQETEADRIGLELMARAGYNPQAAVTIWQKMEALEKASGTKRIAFTSTHPTPGNRIKDLQSLQAQVLPLYQAAPAKYK